MKYRYYYLYRLYERTPNFYPVAKRLIETSPLDNPTHRAHHLLLPAPRSETQ